MVFVWLFLFGPVLKADLSEAGHEDSTKVQ